jgi:hypothetical protein
MTDVSSIRGEYLGRLTHALARVVGAAPHGSAHLAHAVGALKVARKAQSLALSEANRLRGAALCEGAMDVLEQTMNLPAIGGGLIHDMMVVLGEMQGALQCDSAIVLSARAANLDHIIAALDTAVAFYEAQQVNRDIRVSDGADPSKLPDVLAYGEACDGGRCALSFGEGTREDPDRCVKCGALFLRDAETPFGFSAVAA